jgi:septation ring formation regulator EzrA
MRTDYARSCVRPDHAQLEHERTRDEHTLEDVLDLQAKIIEAGDRKSADLMRRASTHLQARWDKVNDLRRMMREDGLRMRDLERDLRDARDALIKAREEIHTAEENLKTLRAIVAGGEIL